MEVDKAWELSVPAGVPTFDTTVNRPPGATDGVVVINAKLRNIIIPKIDFEDRTVEEAIDYLRLRAAELDVSELDPAKKGVNLVIRRPKGNTLGGGEAPAEGELGAGENLLGGGGDLGAARIDELRLRNVPLGVALKYICDKTKLRFKVDDFAVTLVPITEEGDDMFPRTFRVPPDFVSKLMAGSTGTGAPAEADPFAAAGGGGGLSDTLKERPPIIDLLKSSGIKFPEGSAATLGSAGTLLVTNTAAELDKVEQLVNLHMDGEPKQVKITTKFVEITQENSDELGFDWVISPIGGSGGNIFGTAGTVGTGAVRTAADFINPIAGNLIPGIPSSPGTAVTNTPTAGLRSGDYAVNRNSINAILNNPDRSAQNPSVAPGILGVTGLFSDGQVQMIMRGLAQKKGSDLMTAPSVTFILSNTNPHKFHKTSVVADSKVAVVLVVVPKQLRRTFLSLQLRPLHGKPVIPV
jgi:general secretion pathway protein D